MGRRAVLETVAAYLRQCLSALPRDDLVVRVHTDDAGTTYLDAHIVQDWGAEVKARCRTREEADELARRVAALPRRTS